MHPQIDPTEHDLIIRFFGIDPTSNILSGNLNLGTSDFRNIIDFYRFEYKDREAAFWDVVYPKSLLYPNIEIPITMTRVALDWVDYVTKVDVSYTIDDNKLIMNTSPQGDRYNKMLQLICCMIFVSDFNNMSDDKKYIDTSAAWLIIMKIAN